MNTVPSPNADAASRDAASTASASSSAWRTMRIPRPPPPAAALTSAGMATSSGIESGEAASAGVVGTPASIAACFAAILSPSSAICSGVGPIQTMPASITLRAKAAFSARNP